MIACDLKCENGHTFEGWFDDADSFEDQSRRGLVSCPVCDSERVRRTPSTFAIKAAGCAGENPPATSPGLAALGRRISEYVRDNFEDVGCDFAKEALKIHYGASEPRNIRGTSSGEEEKTLREEGVEFMKIPVAPPADAETE